MKFHIKDDKSNLKSDYYALLVPGVRGGGRGRGECPGLCQPPALGECGGRGPGERGRQRGAPRHAAGQGQGPGGERADLLGTEAGPGPARHLPLPVAPGH